MLNLAKNYDDIWKAIIMPPRQEYNLSDMGSAQLIIKNHLVIRTDLSLVNKYGYIIECSYFQQMKNQTAQRSCVIYLHANGCSRIEAVQYLDVIITNNMNLFCFDFSGSGKSQGEYCSLGWNERDDIECVIQYLIDIQKVNKIALWGRSMGAVTALLYAENDPRIKCMIVDSPFLNFKLLAIDFLKAKASLPGFLAGGLYKILNGTIQAKANINLDNLNPMNHVEKIIIPTLYVAAINDTFVPPTHSKELYANHAGPKEIYLFEGDHNSQRPMNLIMRVSEFFKKYMVEAQDKNSEKQIFNNLVQETRQMPNDQSDISKSNLSYIKSRGRITPIMAQIFHNKGDAKLESKYSTLDFGTAASIARACASDNEKDEKDSSIILENKVSPRRIPLTKTSQRPLSVTKIKYLRKNSKKPLGFDENLKYKYPVYDVVSNENHINIPNKLQIPVIDDRIKRQATKNNAKKTNTKQEISSSSSILSTTVTLETSMLEEGIETNMNSSSTKYLKAKDQNALRPLDENNFKINERHPSEKADLNYVLDYADLMIPAEDCSKILKKKNEINNNDSSKTFIKYPYFAELPKTKANETKFDNKSLSRSESKNIGKTNRQTVINNMLQTKTLNKIYTQENLISENMQKSNINHRNRKINGFNPGLDALRTILNTGKSSLNQDIISYRNFPKYHNSNNSWRDESIITKNNFKNYSVQE